MRQHVQLLLAALLVLIGGYAGYQLLFGLDTSSIVVVQRARGEVVHTTAAGASQSVSAGAQIGPRDRLTVGADGADSFATATHIPAGTLTSPPSPLALTVPSATSSRELADVDSTANTVPNTENSPWRVSTRNCWPASRVAARQNF